MSFSYNLYARVPGRLDVIGQTDRQNRRNWSKKGQIAKWREYYRTFAKDGKYAAKEAKVYEIQLYEKTMTFWSINSKY